MPSQGGDRFEELGNSVLQKRPRLDQERLPMGSNVWATRRSVLADREVLSIKFDHGTPGRVVLAQLSIAQGGDEK